MPAMTSSQSVTFRHGSNVEFSESGFPGGSAPGGSDMAPIEGYNLQTVNANKARDFANPMYDAVQSGTTSDPGMSNGSGESRDSLEHLGSLLISLSLPGRHLRCATGTVQVEGHGPFGLVH